MTADERHMLSVKMLGCIVCRNLGQPGTPADAHHLLRGGRRISHRHVIPLCALHHRAGISNALATSRHPWKKEFEERYGTEEQLLEQTNKLLLRGG